MDSAMDAAHTNHDGVSVIIPARDEEATLASCLESLIAQAGIAFEIIVVDDHSTDRTRQIAASFPRVRAIEAPPLTAGWAGKNNAVTAGAREAHGRWLLFTDADTVHLPRSLARAIAEASRHGASMLSYSPEQIVESFCEKAVMPVIFAELAATYSPSRVRDPESPIAAANGQYILITREAYDAVGGHAAIAGAILEDMALARAVKRSGRKIFFRYGGDAVCTRMYRSFSQLREGWTKNLALLFSHPRRLAMLRTLEFVLILSSSAISIYDLLHRHWLSWSLTAVLAAVLYAKFLARIREARFRSEANVLALLGLPLFSYLLLRSKHSHEHGAVSWKGRTYSDLGSQNAASYRNRSEASVDYWRSTTEN
jgi:glycosyltransferase involved in cell wall biosynthesis